MLSALSNIENKLSYPFNYQLIAQIKSEYDGKPVGKKRFKHRLCKKIGMKDSFVHESLWHVYIVWIKQQLNDHNREALSKKIESASKPL